MSDVLKIAKASFVSIRIVCSTRSFIFSKNTKNPPHVNWFHNKQKTRTSVVCMTQIHPRQRCITTAHIANTRELWQVSCNYVSGSNFTVHQGESDVHWGEHCSCFTRSLIKYCLVHPVTVLSTATSAFTLFTEPCATVHSTFTVAVTWVARWENH